MKFEMTGTKEYLKNSIERLLFDLEPKLAMKNFKKSRYENFFREYTQKEDDIYKKLAALFEESEDPSEDMAELAMVLVKKAGETVRATGRFARERRLMDLNCVMAFYVFPGILTIGSERAQDFTLVIAAQWKAEFPNAQLTPGTFEEVDSGFQRRIFGIPIQP